MIDWQKKVLTCAMGCGTMYLGAVPEANKERLHYERYSNQPYQGHL